ncbi:DUF4190 domain-containing protein, partial [Streptomyces sp. SID5785]|nr:DUF4190 domain-containing protein [Streptomyces sp. SID5785]
MAGGNDPQGNEPWAAPQDAVPGAGQPNAAGARGIHDSQTVTAMPAAGLPQAPPPPPQQSG